MDSRAYPDQARSEGIAMVKERIEFSARIIYVQSKCNLFRKETLMYNMQ